MVFGKYNFFLAKWQINIWKVTGPQNAPKDHFVVQGLYNTIASQHLNFDVYVLINPYYVLFLIMIKIYSTALLNTAFSH